MLINTVHLVLAPVDQGLQCVSVCGKFIETITAQFIALHPELILYPGLTDHADVSKFLLITVIVKHAVQDVGAQLIFAHVWLQLKHAMMPWQHIRRASPIFFLPKMFNAHQQVFKIIKQLFGADDHGSGIMPLIRQVPLNLIMPCVKQIETHVFAPYPQRNTA